MHIRSYRFRSAALGMALLLGACASRQPGDPIKPGFNLYSKDQDVQLGRELAQQYLQQMDVVRDERLQQYVRGIVKRLASSPAAGDYPYEVWVINDDAINASALPGGPMFVHTGLIKAADNEGQLAGVLAHEIAHVALRHGTNQASKAQAVQIPAVLAGLALGDQTMAGQLGQTAIGLGMNFLLLRYSRDAETQADALGARILAEAGYNPIEMARFFEKLQAQGGSQPPQFLSSHPNPGNRMAAVEREIQTFPQRQYSAGSGDFSNARQAVAQLPAPRRQQAVERAAAGGPPPVPTNSGLQPLEAGPIRMGYPQDWRSYYDRATNVITIAPPGGVVQSRNGYQIGQGVVISVFRPTQSRSLQDAANELVANLQAVSPDLRQSGPARPAQLSGRQAAMVELEGASPYGGRERITLVAAPYGNDLIYLAFVGPMSNYSSLTPAYQAMLRSVQLR